MHNLLIWWFSNFETSTSSQLEKQHIGNESVERRYSHSIYNKMSEKESKPDKSQRKTEWLKSPKLEKKQDSIEDKKYWKV